MKKSDVLDFSEKISRKEKSPMGPTFRRTRKGSEELVLRRNNLSEDQRKVLLYANGSRSITDIERMIPELAAGAEILMAMEELGFLEMYDPEIEKDPPASSQQPKPTPQNTKPESSSGGGAENQSNTDALKRSLIGDLGSLLGAESNIAITRVNNCSSASEIAALIPKLTELVKLYAGGRKAELFASKYNA